MAESWAVQTPIPVGMAGKISLGWWGVCAFILTEASLFGYLLVSTLYLASQNPSPWPPDGPPELRMPLINTVILLTSSVWVWLAERAMRRGKRRLSLLLLTLTIGFGAAFVAIQLMEWHQQPFGPTTHLYGSLYYTVTGFHMAHVVMGLTGLMFLTLWIALGYFTRERYVPLSIGGIYWHFVDAVWLCVFSVFYLLPYL